MTINEYHRYMIRPGKNMKLHSLHRPLYLISTFYTLRTLITPILTHLSPQMLRTLHGLPYLIKRRRVVPGHKKKTCWLESVTIHLTEN
jgi:hypothetical protein